MTGGNTVLTPDHAAIAAWLDTWFGLCTAGNVEVAWSEGYGREIAQARQFPLANRAQAAEFGARINAVPGNNVYVVASTVSRNDNRRSSDRDFAQAAGVWLDQDKAAHTHATVETLIRPTFTVVTGETPYLRRHLYFQTTEPITDPAEVQALNQRLIGLWGGDTSVHNPVRVMRLPGTIAWPVKQDRVVESTSWVRNADGGRYTLAQLRFGLPKPQEQKPEADAPAPPPGKLNVAEAIRGLAPGSWHDNVIRLIGRYVSKGMTDEEVLSFAPAWTLPGYSVEQTMAEIQVGIDGFRRKHNIVDDPYQVITNRWEQGAEAFANAPPLAQDVAATSLPIYNLTEFVSRYGHRPEFLVEDWLIEAVPTMLTGLPGAGKSPIVQMLIACICLGIPFFGLPVRQTRVVLFAGESANQAALNIKRFAARLLAEANGEEITDELCRRSAEYMDEWFCVIPARFTIETQMDEVIQTVQSYSRARWGGEPPGLAVFDTLRALAIGSPMKDEDVAVIHAAINKCLTVWAPNPAKGYPGVTPLVLHHSPKADPEASSGTNRLEGWADIHLVVTMHAQSGGDPLKALQTWGPDDAGRTYARIRLMARRNKVWATPQPLWMTMVFFEDTLDLEKYDLPGQAPSNMPPVPQQGFAAPADAIARAVTVPQQCQNVLAELLMVYGEMSAADAAERINSMYAGGTPLPKEVWYALGAANRSGTPVASKTQKTGLRNKLEAMVAAGTMLRRATVSGKEKYFYRLKE